MPKPTSKRCANPDTVRKQRPSNKVARGIGAALRRATVNPDSGVPGLLVIEYEGVLSPDQRRQIQATLDGQMPRGVKALVLERGMRVVHHDRDRIAALEAQVAALVKALDEEGQDEAEAEEVPVPRGGLDVRGGVPREESRRPMS